MVIIGIAEQGLCDFQVVGKIIGTKEIDRRFDYLTGYWGKHESANVNKVIGEKGARISGGEKQRLSIARAILKDAPIILLDEATASVDTENEYLIQEAINALVESKTLVIIAHRLSTIRSTNRIIVLNDHDQVEESGKHEELIENKGLYARLWQSRVQAKKWRIGTNGDDSWKLIWRFFYHIFRVAA